MSNEIGPDDILFMGMGRTHVAWYRCFLPALALRSDWIGYGNGPPDIKSSTGFVRGDLQEPVFEDYKVIVVQQPRGREWVEWMTVLQDKGVKILYEVDDDLRAIGKMKTHTNSKRIGAHIKDYDLAMQAADGIIASTPQMAKRVAKFNKNVWVCEAGIDMERYQLQRGFRNDTYTIGFAGGIGHESSLGPWLEAIDATLRPGVKFINVGVDYTDKLKSENKLALPFSQVEAWPSVLANFDVLLAPGGSNGFFRAKGELKWIEAAAMGIPVIANPVPYRNIVHGKTGFIVNTAKELAAQLNTLIADPQLGREVGEAARRTVKSRYHISTQVEQWIKCFELVT